MKTNTKISSSGNNPVLNEKKDFLKKIGLGIAVITTFSATILFSLQDGGMLSKFDNDLQVTPENAGSSWQSSGESNPFRTKLTTSYTAQLDVLTVAVLNKGKNLSYDAFVSYLKNLSTGIVALGKQPAYASNADIQNIIGYLAYEINDTPEALEKTQFMKSLAGAITGSGTTEIINILGSGSTTNTGTSSINARGSLMGVMYLQANSAGTLTNGTTPYRSEKLDLTRKPFNGIECPTGFERVGLGMRMEDAGANNYLTYTCVRTTSQKDFDAAPKGTLMGIIYIPSDAKGNLVNGTNALTNMKLDAVSYPFSGINCPTGSERIGIGLRKEDNGSKNYQVFTCVKTTGSTDYSNVEEGTMMGVVYFQANEKGAHTNGTTPFTNAKLDAVRYPFTGIECPTGFQRMGVGLRMETNATQNYQVGTCVKVSNSNLGAIPANQGSTSANVSRENTTTYTNSSAQSSQGELIYIPVSDLRSENARINFPNGMNVSIPGGLTPEERAYQIEQYTNENYHFQ